MEDVDESVALLGLVGGCPVSDAFHSMPGEELVGVVAEAGQQVCHFSRRSVIDAEFEDRGRGRRGISAVLPSSGPKGLVEEGRHRNRLKQGSSFHGRDFSRR